MQITKAIVIIGRGPDSVSLITNLPGPISVAAGGDEFLFLDFRTPPNKGESYCREVLGVTNVEIIQG